jgi:hypothetical protein
MSRLCVPGLLAALLALVGQLTTGALLPMMIEAELLAPPAVTVMCDATQNPGVPAPRHRHPVAIAICPGAVAVAASPALMPSGPESAPPQALFIHDLSNWLPPGRGPPPPTIRVAQPRAPPATLA